MSDSHSPWSTIDPLLLAVRDRNDQVEVPPATCRANDTVSLEREGPSCALGRFEQDIDDIFALAPGQDAQMGMGMNMMHMDAVDMAAIFNHLQSQFLLPTQTAPVTVFSADGSENTAHLPPSPISDYTLVASPSPCDSLDKDTFLLDGDEHGGDLVVAPTDTLDDFEFTFMCMHPTLDPAVTSVTPPISYFPFVSTGHGYGHPGSQQEGIAADTVAYGPADGGVRENENDSMFSFSITTPTESASPSPSPSPSPPAQEPGDAAVEHAAEEEPLKKRQRNPSGGRPAKRRRVQSTARTHKCPHDDCEFASARNNNLMSHIKSVHEGARPFACKQASCHHAFARKHDADRHFVSKHTGDGSPRRESKVKRALKLEAAH